MSKVYTSKQLQLLRMWQNNELKRINLLEGSVRSGKTWISLVLWAFWVATMPKEQNYLMVAKTLTSLRRNNLDLLQELVGKNNFTYSLSQKTGSLFGRKVYLEGVNDARAESKIRGMTLQGAYCDEITLFNEDFFSMLLSRLSCAGAKLIGTTNPDNPHHWLKEKYIDRANDLDMLVMKFLIDDNEFLDPDYVSNLKKEYTGVYYDRFILGMWKRAEGIVFPDFADNPEKYVISRDKLPNRFKYIGMGYDIGGNGSAYGLTVTAIGFDDIAYVLRSQKIQPQGLNLKDVEIHAIRYIQQAEQDYNININRCYVDDNYYTLVNTLNEWRYMFDTAAHVKSSMPLHDRPLMLSKLMARERFYLVENECEALKDELANVVFDEKSDKPIICDDGTQQIDTIDSFYYSIADNYLYLN